MNNYIFIISLWEKCPHCINFKTKVNASGKTSLEELKEKINALGLEIEEIMRLDSNPKHDFFDLKNSWYPSFYLLDKKEWEEGKVKGYLMGGSIINGEIKKTGIISLNSDKIIEWVKSIISPQINNSYPYFSYEAKLQQLKNDGRW